MPRPSQKPETSKDIGILFQANKKDFNENKLFEVVRILLNDSNEDQKKKVRFKANDVFHNKYIE